MKNSKIIQKLFEIIFLKINIERYRFTSLKVRFLIMIFLWSKENKIEIIITHKVSFNNNLNTKKININISIKYTK